MENFIVSARKYRPSTFNTVVGQHSIITTLKNAIKKDHLAHAYLFCGPRGVGKTSCARIFAKTINCSQITSQMEACNECESCTAFNENRSFNIHELDAASNNSVEDIRNLIDQVRIPPQIGKYSIYIIDEVHMLSAAAFNAFLKTLEEPPEHAIFILATTEKHKIIPTILSRCQIFDFNRIGVNDAVSHLKFVASQESIEIQEEGLNVIAQKADGAMRDALSIFDQIVSFSGTQISYENVIENLNVLDYDYYFRVVDLAMQSKVTEVLLLFNEIIGKGFDGHHFINGLSAHLRDVLVGKDPITVKLLEVGDSLKKKYIDQGQRCPQDFLYDSLKLLSQCDVNYKASQNKRLYVELTLIQLSQIVESKKKGNSLESDIPKIQKINKESAPASSVGAPSTVHVSLNGSNSSSTSSVSKPVAAPSHKEPSVTTTVSHHATVHKGMAKTVSIKDAMTGGFKKTQSTSSNSSKSSSTQVVQPIGDMKKSFSTSEVECKLKEYIVEKRSNERVRCALTAHKPQLKEESGIIISVDNSIQGDHIKEIKNELQNFLKRQLGNSEIQIKTQIIETHSGKKIYTDTDKFNFLCEKNPALSALKQKFSLDFE